MSHTTSHAKSHLSKYDWIFPLFLVLYEIVVYLSNDAYLPALPTILDEFSSTQSAIQFTLTSWFFGSASLQLFLGPISDRYGRRPVLLLGLLVFLTSSIACAFCHHANTLAFARFFEGTGAASVVIAGYATIHELFDQKRAIQILAFMSSMTLLAPGLGPLFGAVILQFDGWRSIFSVISIWAFLMLLVLHYKMPETNGKSTQHLIHPQKILAQYKRIVMNWNFMRRILACNLLVGALVSWIVAGPFLVITHFHYTPIQFGLLQALIFSSYIAGNYLVRWLTPRFPLTHIVNRALIIALLGCVLAIVLGFLFPNFLWGMNISLMIISLGSGLSSPILNRLGIEASHEPMGARMAIFSTFFSGFAMIASVIIGLLFNGSLSSLAIILMIFGSAAFLCAFEFKKTSLTA